VLVRLDALDEVQSGHVLDDPLPRLEPVEPGVLSGELVHPPVEADDLPDLEPVASPDLEVGRIVGGRDLDHTRPELRVDRGVGDDLHPDRPLDRPDLDLLPDVVRVAAVLRMDRQRRVAELRLRPHRGEGDGTILDVEQLRCPFLVLDFEVREHRPTPRAPVDDVVAPVDETFLPEADEDLPDRRGQSGIHREALPLPVAGGSQAPELAKDRAAGLLLPLPHALDERVAADRLAGQPLRGELPFHDHLRCDSRVIGAGLPEDVEPLHALPAHQDVLEGVV
jgi:hypothetical protein